VHEKHKQCGERESEQRQKKLKMETNVMAIAVRVAGGEREKSLFCDIYSKKAPVGIDLVKRKNEAGTTGFEPARHDAT
jgi:hypothetical protein